MAQTQLTEFTSSTSRLQAHHQPVGYQVFVKGTWAGAWEPVDYLRVQEVTKALWPTGDSATLRYVFGKILQADVVVQDGGNQNPAAQDYPKKNFKGKFVKIVTTGRKSGNQGTNPNANGEQETPAAVNNESNPIVFMGVIVNQNDQVAPKPSNSDPGGGEQILQAKGMEYLLSQIKITEAYVENHEDFDVVSSARVWHFNNPTWMGLHEYGNRSATRHDGLDGNSYMFGTDGGDWTTKDILEYLLNQFNSVPAFKLTGQLENLEGVYRGQGRFHGMNVKRVVESLIDRRRGLVCWTHITEGEEIELKVASILDVDVGGFKANPDVMLIDLDARLDVQSIQITEGIYSQYRAVTVRGGLAKVMFTVEFETISFGDTPTLIEGWSEDDEIAYRTVSSGDGTPEENDQERATGKYEHVFRRLLVNPAWGWRIVDRSVIPEFDTRAFNQVIRDVSSATDVPDWGGVLLRQLLVPEENDENGTGAVNYRAPFAVIQDPDSGKWHYLHRLDVLGQRSMGLRVLDRQMGVELTGAFNHLVALNNWADETPAATDTNNDPAFDYQTIKVTVAAETDVRPTVLEQITPRAGGELVEVPEAAGTLLIEVEDVEHWSIAPGTILDIEDGQPTKHASPYTVLRDDTARLRLIADLAKVWYSVPRQSANITFNQMAFEMKPGTMIEGYFGRQSTYEDINTVISSVTHRFDSHLTMVKTQYMELDFTGAS